MLWFKITLFVFFVSLLIWRSSYDPQLHKEINYVCGPQPRKQPNRLLDAMLVFLIFFGGGIMVYFLPSDMTGITGESILGLLVMAIVSETRDSIYN